MLLPITQYSNLDIRSAGRRQEMKWGVFLFKKVENGGCFFVKVDNGGCFVKKWTFPQRKVHYV